MSIPRCHFAARVVGKNTFSLCTDFLCPDRVRNLCAEYFDLAAIGLPQERGDLFGKVGSAVHHRQQDTVYLELGVDLPLYLVYRGEQLFQPFGGQILCLNGNYDPVRSGQPDSQVRTGCCFANAAFLVGDGDDLRVH